jgi:hypothetical protein
MYNQMPHLTMEQQQQIEKMEKLKQRKSVELDHNLTNMLIHLYNGKQCTEYIKEYKVIQEAVSFMPFSLSFIADMDQKKLWSAIK